MKPLINSVEVHPQLSNNGHPVDGALVGAGSVWPQRRVMSIPCLGHTLNHTHHTGTTMVETRNPKILGVLY
jgi:hypothetical protein